MHESESSNSMLAKGGEKNMKGKEEEERDWNSKLHSLITFSYRLTRHRQKVKISILMRCIRRNFFSTFLQVKQNWVLHLSQHLSIPTWCSIRVLFYWNPVLKLRHFFYILFSFSLLTQVFCKYLYQNLLCGWTF